MNASALCSLLNWKIATFHKLEGHLDDCWQQCVHHFLELQKIHPYLEMHGVSGVSQSGEQRQIR